MMENLNQVRFDEDMIPVFAIVLGILGIALPASVFRMAWKWAEKQPDNSGAVLGGAVIISIVSLLTAGLILLAVVGWLPVPTHWFRS